MLTHPPTLLLLALVLQVALALAPDPVRALPGIVQASGGVLIVLGIALNVAAERGFKREDTAVRPFEPPRSLVTAGVFRWTRNPMYLGLVLILLGTAIVLASLWALVVVPAFFALMDRLIRHEEALMEATFGEEYRNYLRRARRWL
jgi:protein-S-isoprenylcysteine O-methyltransferase Ste14